MCFIIIFLIIILFILGIRTMKKIDLFVSDIQVEDGKCKDKKNTILIYGDGKIKDRVIHNFDGIDLNYKIVTESSILKEKFKYKFLLIVSDNDLDNLMLCSLGKKMLKIKNVISVCNDKNNERLFYEYGVISFDSEYICSDKFLLVLKEKNKNE